MYFACTAFEPCAPVQNYSQQGGVEDVYIKTYVCVFLKLTLVMHLGLITLRRMHECLTLHIWLK